MKKLLLTSDGFVNPKIAQEFLILVNKKPADIKVLFVPTAAEYEFENKEEMFYVKESERELIADLGIPKENIVWFNMKNASVAGDIQSFDVMYMCGGNTYYLLNEIRNTGFDKKIIEFVESGKIYVGVSAGSIIMGPNISTSADKNQVGLKDTNAFNFFDQSIVPHYQKKEKSVIDEFEKNNPWKVLRLRDSQAVCVRGESYKVIE